MTKPLKLTRTTLEKKFEEKSEDIILYEDFSSIKTFRLSRAKDLPVVAGIVAAGEAIYKMPSDTTSILQTNSRTAEGDVETDILKSRLGDGTPVVVPMSNKMQELVSSMEHHSGYPLKVVFAKREKGSIFLCHKEPLELPLKAKVKAYGELLNFANRIHRLKILKSLPLELGNLQQEHFIIPKKYKPLCTGSPAHPGLVVAEAHDRFAAMLTTPADVGDMKKAKVILTGGGLLSHAALLAASEGIPCVVGLSEKDIFAINSHTDAVSVDAYSGKVYLAGLKIKSDEGAWSEQVGTILNYAHDFVELEVYANAESASAITAALDAGAMGIGLFRTEHMFQDQTVLLSAYMKAALKNEHHTRREVLAKLLKVSKGLFKAAFEAVGSSYICIRLLDAPLNEFGAGFEEENPMMGLRGCRFGILFSDFYAMQVQAIAEAYIAAGKECQVGIMVPLVSEVGEVIVLRDLVERVWATCGEDPAELKFGVMIETPRACLIAGEVAPYCEFLSYGTNDLTQFTFAFSRDDATYLPNYAQLGVLEYNPFESLDARGVGRLITLSVMTALETNPEVQFGICGNHAGDPESIALVNSIGFHYVSCTQANIAKAVLSLVRSS